MRALRLCPRLPTPPSTTSLADRLCAALPGTITVLFTTLFLTGLIKYLPHHLGFVQRRAAYYLLGRETDAGELLGWAWNSGAEVTSGVRREISRLVSKVEL